MVGDDDNWDRVKPNSVTISLQSEGGESFPMLEKGQGFATGYSGELF